MQIKCRNRNAPVNLLWYEKVDIVYRNSFERNLKFVELSGIENVYLSIPHCSISNSVVVQFDESTEFRLVYRNMQVHNLSLFCNFVTNLVP